jgi:predicted small metal-binding protein
MKTLRCRDAGFDCNEEIRGQNDQEIMTKAAEHAKKAHGLQVTPEMAQKIKSLIHDDRPPQEATIA